MVKRPTKSYDKSDCYTSTQNTCTRMVQIASRGVVARSMSPGQCCPSMLPA